MLGGSVLNRIHVELPSTSSKYDTCGASVRMGPKNRTD